MKIRNKLILAIAIAFVLVNILFSFYQINKKQQQELKRLEKKIENINELVKYTSIEMIWDVEKKNLEQNIQSFVQDSEIAQINLKDKTGEIELSIGKLKPENQDNYIKRKFLIEKNKQVIGEAIITYSKEELNEKANEIIIQNIISSAILIIITIIIIYFISYYHLRPINKIIIGLQKIDEGNYNYSLSLNSNDEFKQIELFFNKMADTIKHDIEQQNRQKEQLLSANRQLKKEIDERIKVEEQLSESRELYKLITDNATDIISQLTTDGIFTYVSSACEHLLGYHPEELINKNSYFYIYQEDIKILQNSHQKIVAEKISDTVIYRIKNKQNQYIWFETTSKTMFDPTSNTTKITSVSRDISLRKKYEDELQIAKEKAEKSDLLKSAFLANMSHEIRTPMNGILGFAEFLKNENISKDKRKKFVDIIYTSSQNLLTLINDIMDISKIEAEQITISKIECELNLVLDDIFTFYNNYKDSRNKTDIELILEKEQPDENMKIYLDIDRFRQILTNLIGNALKFTKEGYIKFGYKLMKTGQENYLQFYVEDTGIGIQKDKQEVIFERFRQEDDSLTRQYGGTGLGLPISKGLITLMGGKIWVESKKGKGTTFYFTIPYKPINKNFEENGIETTQENTVFSQADQTLIDSNYKWTNKKILIVEDDPISVIFLDEIIEPTKAKILYAEDGEKAIEITKNEIPDIILMDMQLPVMNGYDATTEIRKFNKKIPIIAQTANAMVDDQAKCMDVGCNKYVKKPIDADFLLKTIDELI